MTDEINQLESDISDWWIENEELREFLNLPPYKPPRFKDDEYTHAVVPALEEKYDCEIQFLGVNTEYLEDWEVRIDGEFNFWIGRRRDENGNTVYGMESEEFREKIDSILVEAYD